MTDKPTNRGKGENIHTRVMVLVHDPLSECMKFRCNTSNGYQIISWTRNMNADQRKITKNVLSKVMVLVHATLSHCALEVYEVSFK